MGDCHGGFVFALVCAQHRLRIDGNHLWPAKNTINVRHGLQYLYTVVDDVWLTVTTRHNKLATTLGDWSTPSRGNEMCYACNPISTILQLSKHPNSVIIDKNLRRQTRVLRLPDHDPYRSLERATFTNPALGVWPPIEIVDPSSWDSDMHPLLCLAPSLCRCMRDPSNQGSVLTSGRAYQACQHGHCCASLRYAVSSAVALPPFRHRAETTWIDVRLVNKHSILGLT